MKRVILLALGATLLVQPAIAIALSSFVMLDTPKPLPPITFQDVGGRTGGLADFSGKTVLLNVWATWCIPCRKEMPTLDRLQAQLGGPDFEVVTLSIDRGGIEAVRKFYAELGIQHLAAHVDPTSAAAGNLGVVGLPTTLLIDGKGRELGRLIGPAEWDSPEMVAFLKAHIPQSNGSPAGTN